MPKTEPTEQQRIDDEWWFVENLPDKLRPYVAVVVAQTRHGTHTVCSATKRIYAEYIAELHNEARAQAAFRAKPR